MRRSSRPGSPSAAHGNLPTELNRFVGRHEELAELGRLLMCARLVTMTGVGGVGKTRFALHAAGVLQERYADGVWLAELSALPDPELLEHAVVEELGLTDHTTRPPREVLLEHLAGRELLLVLDGFEHLVDSCADLVRELLREALLRYREIGELNSNALMGQVELAMAVAFRGDLAQAVLICEEVTEACEDHGERWTLAYALYVLAYAARAHGRPERTRELPVECLAIDHTFHDLLGLVLTLELLALVTLDQGDPAEAAVLQGPAERIWPSVGLPLFGSAYYSEPHTLCEKQARERLGDGTYEKLRHEGAGLAMDTAVARALAGPTHPVLPRPCAVSPPRKNAPHTREPAASRSVRSEETTG
ncbi:hypothetical protein [Streptomyces sp. H27-C3]|uniref:nSTAND1 domain-containing NTPase n=1 Tax=Streptomyces sp. H27-C3 TaxID=3046305 RepID=UPI0024BB7C32|nr:hypothetical protein [Streptomyces sp. H27-C3]MDJ0464807.1 hypothetical protein [Streptomyces sp. H27-C3]